MIDLEPKQLELIKRILAEHAPDCEVRAFGSRVTGKSRKYSDLDIVVFGSTKIDWRRIEALKDAFAESDLTIVVDVLDGNTISDSFREVIEKRYEVIQKP
ncbi:MAG: nucleotidyltransferase family protein [Armatimonadota bacterium]